MFLLTSGGAGLSLPVASSFISSNARDLGTVWVASASVRGSIQHPVFRIYCYSCEGTGAQFEVHARTNYLSQLDCEGPGVKTSKSFAAFWLVEMGHVNKLMTYPMLMRHVTKNNSPIVFSALWLVTTYGSHPYYCIWYFCFVRSLFPVPPKFCECSVTALCALQAWCYSRWFCR